MLVHADAFERFLAERFPNSKVPGTTIPHMSSRGEDKYGELVRAPPCHLISA